MSSGPQKYLIYAVLWSFSGDGRLKMRAELGEYIRRITTVPLPAAPNVPIIDYEVRLIIVILSSWANLNIKYVTTITRCISITPNIAWKTGRHLSLEKPLERFKGFDASWGGFSDVLIDVLISRGISQKCHSNTFFARLHVIRHGAIGHVTSSPRIKEVLFLDFGGNWIFYAINVLYN